MSVQDAMGFSKAENSKSVRLLRAQLLGQLPIFLSENSIAWSIFLSIFLQSVELNVKFSAIVKKTPFQKEEKVIERNSEQFSEMEKVSFSQQVSL